MNNYLKSFLHRGLLFGGFGPVVVGIVYAILAETLPEFSLSGGEVCLAIVSTYLLAFLQAGDTVFNQIEHWSVPKSLFCHFLTLYLAYALCYIMNTWIPFVPQVLLIFTGIFVGLYLIIWLTVYLSVRAAGNKMNKKLS